MNVEFEENLFMIFAPEFQGTVKEKTFRKIDKKQTIGDLK